MLQAVVSVVYCFDRKIALCFPQRWTVFLVVSSAVSRGASFYALVIIYCTQVDCIALLRLPWNLFTGLVLLWSWITKWHAVAGSSEIHDSSTRHCCWQGCTNRHLPPYFVLITIYAASFVHFYPAAFYLWTFFCLVVKNQGGGGQRLHLIRGSAL